MIAWLLLGLAFAGADGPEISTSTGKPTQIVVLYPRVIPASEDPQIHALAAKVQAKLGALAAETGRELDTRPAPERVCPRGTGCKAPSVGAVLAHQGGGCVVLATTTKPGQEPHMATAWAGKMTLSAPSVPFREPPEGLIKVLDFAPCDQLEAELEKGKAPVSEAIKAALPS